MSFPAFTQPMMTGRLRTVIHRLPLLLLRNEREKWMLPTITPITTFRSRLPRGLLASLALLLALLLAASLALLLLSQFAPRVLAASLFQMAGTTCVQAPTIQHCANQDPQLQGCAADAQTLAQADIVENGFVIGRVERRYSPHCHSWWGRVFDERVGSHANMFITIAGTTTSAAPTFVSTSLRILYSPMQFAAVPLQPIPAITGSLLIDGVSAPVSATLPAMILRHTLH